MTVISRDRIQFEDMASRVNDGNEQQHTRSAACEWAAAATEFLERNGGGAASVGNGKDLRAFRVRGNDDLASEADRIGMDAAEAYIEGQIASLVG